MRCVRRMSWQERAELWRRWRRGESLSEIGRALHRLPGSVFAAVAATGGVVPAGRRRSPRALTAREREEISRAVARGASVRQISRSVRCAWIRRWRR